MCYIVLDMEWNQRIKGKPRVRFPVLLNGEIIQIGAVKLDEKFSVIGTFKIMVSPQYYTQMHEVVSEITKITAEDLRYGFPFKIAFDHFKKWCGDEFILLTWGFDDIKMLRDNMVIHDLDITWIPATYNLQVIFDQQILKEHRQISLTAAMNMVNESALEAHDALNDAKNTACICRYLDIDKGLSEYEECRKEMRCCISAVTQAKKPDKVYTSKHDALKDPELVTFYHSDFDEVVTCRGFVSQSNEKYISIAQGKSGKELFVRFKFKKWGENEYSVSRMVYEMDEKHIKYYWDRRNIKNQRKIEKYTSAKYYKKKFYPTVRNAV